MTGVEKKLKIIIYLEESRYIHLVRIFIFCIRSIYVKSWIMENKFVINLKALKFVSAIFVREAQYFLFTLIYTSASW